MTDIHNQNPTSDQDLRSPATQNGSTQNFDTAVHLPAQAAGAQVDPFTSGPQPKGKRRGKKPNKGQQEAAFANSQDQTADGQGAEKPSGGGIGGGNTLLYVAGGLAVVGAGAALAGGGGSSTPPVPSDTTPPTAPTAALATDTGSSSSDRITSNGRIDVGGLETGATWEYSTNGGTSWQAGSGTSFTLSAGTYADGAVLVRQKDAAGNVSANGKPAGAVTIDATAPSADVIAQVAGDGTVNAAEKAAGITISGTGETGSSVSVVWGAVTKTATVTAGAWTVQFASADVPADGATTVSVTLTDLAGNVSAAAQRAVTVDTRLLVQGSIVAGPLVAGHGLTVALYTSGGTLIQSGIAVANDGSFSARVAANLGDVLIAKVTDSGTGVDYSDEATGAAKDLNAALFAAVIVSDLSAPVQAQVNPVTTLAAIKAGLGVDGSGTINGSTAVQNANALVAKALGLDDIKVAPIATNGGGYVPSDGLSAGEKVGAVLATLSGLDVANAGDTQKSLEFLAAQIGASGQSLSADGLAALVNGAAAAALRTDGKLEAVVSDLLAESQQSAAVSIDAVATDNVVSASELAGLVITGTVSTGATSVALSLGSWSGTAVVSGGTWSYALSASDASALGSDGAKVLVATAVLANGQTAASSRGIVLDTTAPVATTIDMISGNDAVNAAEKLAGVVIAGTAEAKSSIRLNWGGAEFSTQADLAGRWTLTVPSAQVPASGNTTVSVVATDVNNNAGQPVTRNVSVDTTPPSKPIINVLSQDDVLGAPEVASGIVLTGAADPGAKVLLRWGGGAQYSAFANDLGEWTISIPASGVPAPGVRSITAQAEDSAGNLSDNATRDVTLYGALTAPVILSVTGDDVVNVSDSTNGIALKGLAPANALVRVVWGSTTVTAVADAFGNWVAQFGLADLPADGNATITATIVDALGAEFGSSSRSVAIDTTIPSAALVDAIAQNNVVNGVEKSAGVDVSGTAEAGAKVEVTWGGVTKTTNASSLSAWTVRFATGDIPADGSTTVQAKATDAAGNASQITTRPVMIDSVVPVTPNVSLAGDTGQSSSDFITKNVNFKVFALEPGASWSYSSDRGQNWEAGNSARFTSPTGEYAIFPLTDGKYEVGQILVRQTDAAGNESSAHSNTDVITIDTAPEELSIDQVTGDDIVSLAEKSAGVTVTGTFEPGSSVAVTWGSVVKNAPTADGEGKWSVTFLPSEVPADGNRLISASATDIAGNSTSVAPMSIIIDTVAPDALGVTVSDTGSSPTDGITSNGIINISNLAINGDWEYSTNAGVTWSAGSETSFPLSQGVYEADTVLVRQKDAAGNTGASTAITRKLVVDTAAVGLSISQVGSDGVVNIAEKGSGVTVSGFAEAFSSVQVTWVGVNKLATAGQDGAWSVNYTSAQVPADGPYEIQAVQTDIAGNVSDGVILPVVVNTVRPAAPQIADVSTNNIVNGAEKLEGISVSGTAVANGRVVVQWGAVSKAVDADEDGNWSALFSASDIPADGTTAISATVTNAIGNTSNASVPRSVFVDTIVDAPSLATVSGDGRVNADEKRDGVTVTGVAEGNAQVVVRWGTAVKTVSANLGGQWTASFSSTDIPADADSSISLSQTDAVGNASNVVSVPVVIDTRAPNLPSISAIAGDDIITSAEKTDGVQVFGRAEANSNVTAIFGGRSQTVAADGVGIWSTTFASANVPADGDQLVTVTAKDAAGNISSEASRLITVATAPTTAPVIAVIASDNLVGASEKAAGVRVSGVAAANSTVTVAWGSATKTVFANGQGGWTASFASSDIPADGAYTVTATVDGVTGSRQVNVDASPPAAPVLAIAAAAQNTAVATGASGAVTVSAEAGSSIQVVFTTGAGSVSKLLTATGATQAVVLTAGDLTTLGNGMVNVSATATGSVSGVSQSSTASFEIDTVAPAAAQLGVVATDQAVDILEQAQGVSFAGTAEGNAQIVVQWGTSSKTVTASSQGAWSALFAAADVPADGARTATISVKDAANNTASSTAIVQVATTPYIALTKGAELIVTKDMFALSANETSPTSTGITISGLANGEFRKGGSAVTQFTLKDVQDGLVTFVHDNSVNAPSFNVAVSDGAISSAAKAAQIFFVPSNLAGLDDALTGTSTADLLIGGDGNDVIRGGQGSDVLYGHGSGVAQGLDNDTFVWGSGDAGLGASDVIRDFTAWNGTSGDKLDLSALLVGYQAGTSDIAQWISVQNNVTMPGATGWDVGKTGALLTIDIDGAGSGTVTQTIFLANVSLATTNPSQLLSGGVILA